MLSIYNDCAQIIWIERERESNEQTLNTTIHSSTLNLNLYIINNLLSIQNLFFKITICFLIYKKELRINNLKKNKWK